MADKDPHVLDGHAAGFVSRLFAVAMDIVVVAGVVAIGGWIAVLVDNIIGQLGFTTRVSLGTIYVFCIPFIIGLYFVMFWSLTGRTIGKWMMGLRVVALNGHPPTIWHSTVRAFGYAVSAIVFWLGFFWVIIDDNRKAWHDHMARTWVVYDYSRRQSGEAYQRFLEDNTST